MREKPEGACHCGAVGFLLNRQPGLVVNCHCDECRKRNGSALSTYLAVSESDLEITRGRARVKEYIIEKEGTKYFCMDCGSPLYNRNLRFPGLFMVFYGAMANARGFPPGFNVFCESKHEWVDSIADIRSFNRTIER